MDNEKRKYIRHPLSYPLQMRVLKEQRGHTLVKSRSENIGGGGLLFQSGVEIKEGIEVEITLSIEGRDFLLDGTIVRSEPIGNGDYNVAVSFHKPDEVLKARMMEQVVRIEEFKQRLERRCHKRLDFDWVANQWIKRYSKFFAEQYDI
jgi:hypothetical protein